MVWGRGYELAKAAIVNMIMKLRLMHNGKYFLTRCLQQGTCIMNTVQYLFVIPLVHSHKRWNKIKLLHRVIEQWKQNYIKGKTIHLKILVTPLRSCALSRALQYKHQGSTQGHKGQKNIKFCISDICVILISTKVQSEEKQRCTTCMYEMKIQPWLNFKWK
jgi:hypothetical protein